MAKQSATLKAYERQPNENFSDHIKRLEKLIEELTKLHPYKSKVK